MRLFNVFHEVVPVGESLFLNASLSLTCLLVRQVILVNISLLLLGLSRCSGLLLLRRSSCLVLLHLLILAELLILTESLLIGDLVHEVVDVHVVHAVRNGSNILSLWWTGLSGLDRLHNGLNSWNRSNRGDWGCILDARILSR